VPSPRNVHLFAMKISDCSWGMLYGSLESGHWYMLKLSLKWTADYAGRGVRDVLGVAREAVFQGPLRPILLGQERSPRLRSPPPGFQSWATDSGT